MSLLYKPYTIDFGAGGGKRSELQKKVYRECGCPYGRVCMCELTGKEPDDKVNGCGRCDNCKRNARQRKRVGRPGRLKCLFPPEEVKKMFEVRVGASMIRLHQEQIDFFKSKTRHGGLLESLEESTTSNFSASLSENFSSSLESESLLSINKDEETGLKMLLESDLASMSWIKLHILRAAYQKRSLELNTTLDDLKQELSDTCAELEAIQSKLKITQDDSIQHFIDTKVAHGVWQRLPIKKASSEVKKRRKVLESNLRKYSNELEKLEQGVFAVAAAAIQRTFRAYSTRKQLERREAARIKALRNDGATKISKVFRGYRGRKKAKVARHFRQNACSLVVQRVFRGHIGREIARERRRELARQRARKAASAIQSHWRKSISIQIMKQEEEVKRQEQAAADLTWAAIDIQRVGRGFLARRRRRIQKLELTLGPRVRELCNQFIAKGDLFHFLEAVNKDYQTHLEQQSELRRIEMENATTFIKEVVAYREQEIERKWGEWEHQKRKIRPNATAAKQFDAAIQIPQSTMYVGSIVQRSEQRSMKGGNTEHQRRERKRRNRIEGKGFSRPGHRQAYDFKYESLVEKEIKTKERELLQRGQAGKLRKLNTIYKRKPRQYTNLTEPKLLQEVENMTQPEISDNPPPIVLLASPEISMRSPAEPGGLEIRAADKTRNILFPDSFSSDFTKIVFSDCMGMDEPVDKIVFQAALVEEFMKHQGEREFSESAFHHFLLTAPPFLKLGVEEQAWNISRVMVRELGTRSVASCGDLLQELPHLLNEKASEHLPKSVLHRLLTILSRIEEKLALVRPKSVQDQWKVVERKADPTLDQFLHESRSNLSTAQPLRSKSMGGESNLLRSQTANGILSSSSFVFDAVSERPTTDMTIGYSDNESHISLNTGLNFSDELSMDRILLNSSQSMRVLPSREYTETKPETPTISFVRGEENVTEEHGEKIAKQKIENSKMVLECESEVPAKEEKIQVKSCSRESAESSKSVSRKPSSVNFPTLSPRSECSDTSSVDTVDWQEDKEEEETLQSRESKSALHSRQGSRLTRSRSSIASRKSRQKYLAQQFLGSIRGNVAQIKLSDSIHLVITQAAVEVAELDGLGCEEFAEHLVAADDPVKQRELLARRLQQADEFALPFSTLLSESGFHKIESLAACRLGNFPIPNRISDRVMELFNLISRNLQFEYLPFDPRYQRSEFSSEAINGVPLPRIRLMNHDKARKSPPKLNRKIVEGSTRKEQLVNRLIQRSRTLGKYEVISPKPKSQSDIQVQSKSYFDFKHSHRIGENTIYATAAEVKALEQWHPFVFEN